MRIRDLDWRGEADFSSIGWTKHQGESRLTIYRHYRVKELVTLLVQNLIDLPPTLGLKQLSIEDNLLYLFA